jgi:ribonuclease-3
VTFPRDSALSVRGGDGVPGRLTLKASLDPERKKSLRVFLKSVRIKFKHVELLHQAFIHRSAVNEAGFKCNNERLEFLGDSVLGVIAASLLYCRLPDKNEGDLAKIKSVVVSEEILSGLALELGIDRLLVLGKGEERTGGRGKKAILADALEALIGAIYLDGGFPAARDFVSARIDPEISRVLENGSPQDYKSLLQEYTQRLYKTCPVYRLVKLTGPEHNKLFFIEVTINGASYGPCTGRNKKSAEQEAAKLAWDTLTAASVVSGKE